MAFILNMLSSKEIINQNAAAAAAAAVAAAADANDSMLLLMMMMMTIITSAENPFARQWILHFTKELHNSPLLPRQMLMHGKTCQIPIFIHSQ